MKLVVIVDIFSISPSSSGPLPDIVFQNKAVACTFVVNTVIVTLIAVAIITLKIHKVIRFSCFWGHPVHKASLQVRSLRLEDGGWEEQVSSNCH